MIKMFTGTNGSGKSLHTMEVVYHLGKRRNIIANFPIKLPYQTNKKNLYVDNTKLTPNFLVDFAKKNHDLKKEHQTLVIIDECQLMFNTRDYKDATRKLWLRFFPLHRKYGYDFILVCPYDRAVDKQVRTLVEYEVKHRKFNNYGLIGMLCPFSVFVAVETWYPVKGQVVGRTFFRYKKKYANMYDTFRLFEGGGAVGN